MHIRRGNPYPVGALSNSRSSGNVQVLVFKVPQDGWITQIAVYAGGYNGPTKASVCMWRKDDANNPLIYESAKQDWPDGASWKYVNLNPPMRVTAGKVYFIGFVNDPDNGGSFWRGYTQWSFAVGFPYSKPYFNMVHVEATASGVPAFLDTTNSGWVFPPAMYIVQIVNKPPLAGSWTGVSPVGEISTSTPVFEGTMPHPAEEEGLDSTSLVHLQITRTDTGVSLYNQTFEPTVDELKVGRFSRSPLVVPYGAPITARFRHADLFGVWSTSWSPSTSFTYGAGPNAPTITSPGARLNVLGGFNYSGTYSHPDGYAANAVQIEVYNEVGTARLFNGTIALSPTLASGGTWTVAEFHADLSWGSGYQIRARLKDTTETWGRWSPLQKLRTNGIPYQPFKLSPSGGSTTSNAVLSASILDPDGDTITQVRLDIADADTGVSLATFPKVAGSINGQLWTYNSTADLTSGKDYKWRVQAYDGYVYGSYSSWATFRYRQIPSVSLLHPSLAGLRNMVTRPSAEYATDVAYWTDSGETVSNYIETVNDGDAAFGQYAWRGQSDNTITNAARRSPMKAINAERMYVLKGQFKKEDRSLPASTSFRFRCFDSANVFLGNVTPVSSGGLDRSNVDTHWSDYGGVVYPSTHTQTVRWPTGTTQVEIEIVPVDLSVANPTSSVRFDSINMYELSTVIEPANLGAVQSWFGYFDGDTEGFRPSTEDYYWSGLPGESSSLGLNVLESSIPSLIMSYSSPNASLKANDRVYIEQWSTVEEAWKNVYDSGWAGGDRLVIPIPSGILLNERRYRVQVAAVDSQAIPQIGFTDWVEFDLKAVGPPELNVTDIFGNPDNATVTFRFEQTQLSVSEFGGIEIKVQPEGEPAIIYELIQDPQRTEVIYPYPVSGRPTTYSVRQIQFADNEDISSRWVNRVISLDYYPRFFLKDVDDPLNLYVGWTPHPGAVPSRNSERDMHEFVPWGSRAPVHLFSESRYDSGDMSIWLRKDPKILASSVQRYEVLEEMDRRRRTLCYLSNAPKIKRFVSATSFSYSVNELEENIVDVNWSEDNYTEDYYLREEARIGS